MIASMKYAQRLGARGFTVIEIIVVLALVGILSTLAIPSLRVLLNNQALSNSASDFLSGVIQARSAALKANRRAIIQPILDNDWRTGWMVYIDINSNGVYDASVDTLVLTREPLPADVAINSGTGSGDSATVTVFGFSADGFLEAISGSRNGSVVMQSSFTGRKKFITVSKVGRARICDPVASPGCEPS